MDVRFKDTNSDVLNFFLNASGNTNGGEEYLKKSLIADPYYTSRILLFLVDIGGVYHEYFDYYEKNMPYTILLYGIIPHMIKLNAWSELFEFMNPDIRLFAFTQMSEALQKGDGVCAGQMPLTGPRAAELAAFMGLTPQEYSDMMSKIEIIIPENPTGHPQFDGFSVSPHQTLTEMMNSIINDERYNFRG